MSIKYYTKRVFFISLVFSLPLLLFTIKDIHTQRTKLHKLHAINVLINDKFDVDENISQMKSSLKGEFDPEKINSLIQMIIEYTKDSAKISARIKSLQNTL